MRICVVIPYGIHTCILLLLALTSSAQTDRDNSPAGRHSTIRRVLPLSTDSIVKQSFASVRSSFSAAGHKLQQQATSQKQLMAKQLTDNLPLSRNFLNINSPALNVQFNNSAITASGEQLSKYQKMDVSTDVAIWGVPFSFGYNAGFSNDELSDRLAFNTTRFDKEKYLQQLRQAVSKVANPEELFSQSLSELYAKRENVIKSMKSDFAGAIKSSNTKLINEMGEKLNAENLSRLGANEVLNNMLNEQTALLSQKQALLLQMQKDVERGALPADSVTVLSTEITELIQVNEQLETRSSLLKDEWQKKGKLQMVSGFEQEKKSLINKLLNDPQVIAKVASQKIKLSGLQKMLLNTNTLKVGASGTKQNPLGLHNALLKGVQFDFLKKNRFFAPVIGTQPGIKNIQDFSYTNFSNLANVFTAGLRLGKGDMSGNFSHFSFFLFQQNNNQQYLSGNVPGSLPQNFVTSFSKRIFLGRNHTLLTEVSKSTLLYRGRMSGENGNALKGLSGQNNFFENMGVNLSYSGELASLGIVENLTIKYTGREYNNLGNAFMTGGTKEISNDIKKQLLKRKLVIGIRGQYREYDLGADGHKWQNFSWLADIKWKFKKGEFIEVRYQPYFTRRSELASVYASNKSNRFALRGNINRKIWRGFSYRNFIEVSSAKDEWLDVSQHSLNINRTFSFTSLQTLTLDRQTLFANCMVNRTLNNTGYLFMNSSLSVDAGTGFMVRRRLQLSSSLVYNEVNHFYGQLAIRQSLSSQLGNHFTADGFMQAGKNLYQPEFMQVPTVTGNVSIHYSIK